MMPVQFYNPITRFPVRFSAEDRERDERGSSPDPFQEIIRDTAKAVVDNYLPPGAEGGVIDGNYFSRAEITEMVGKWLDKNPGQEFPRERFRK